MLYKVLIVDDEQIIRDGLNSIVDWNSMGFQIEACLSDGKDALKYIKDNKVDVILTDIKMTFVSGLDVALYIYRNNLPIKVVIISGYRDFEYAKQALQHNVTHYLLKPTQLNEINRVFSEIKEQLDNELINKEKNEIERKKNKELEEMLQEQFFTDLLTGALKNEEEIDKKLKFIYNGLAGKRICLVDAGLSWENTENIEINSEKSNSSIIIKNFLNFNDDGFAYIPILYNNSALQVISIFPDRKYDIAIDKLIKKHFLKADKNAKSIFGICIEYKGAKEYKSMLELAMKAIAESPLKKEASKDIRHIISEKDFLSLNEKKNLLVAHVRNADRECANSLFQSLMAELKNMDIKVVHYFMVGLFATIKENMDIQIDGRIECQFKYDKTGQLDTVEKIQNWGIRRLCEIIEFVKANRTSAHINVIERVRQYINDNYSRDITLDGVSNISFLSPVYLSRLFKQKTGENFSDYIVKVRMQKAKELLRQPGYRIYEIGNMVGYKSTRHFYRIFKNVLFKT